MESSIPSDQHLPKRIKNSYDGNTDLLRMHSAEDGERKGYGENEAGPKQERVSIHN